MKRYTQRQLKAMVKDATAIDITHGDLLKILTEPISQIGYSSGVYGCNGALLEGEKSGTLYVITSRTTNLFKLV